jgi:hypothetical protein
MIYFISHFEGIKGRDAHHLIKLLAPVIKWNFDCVSSFSDVKYLVMVNDSTERLIEEISPGLTVNTADLFPSIVDDIQNLACEYNKINMSGRLNYGVDFEYKCFERFFLAHALASNVNGDYFVHLDCDLALSANAINKYIKTFDSSSQHSHADVSVFAPTDYSTYLCGFNRASLKKFCEYINNNYLNNSNLYNEGYRVSDMGALKSALDNKCLRRHSPFGDFDHSYLTTDLMSFQPLASFLAASNFNLPTDHESTRWWRLDDVSEVEIQRVASNHYFFKLNNNGFKIERNGVDAYFIHFHGRTKLFIKHLF